MSNQASNDYRHVLVAVDLSHDNAALLARARKLAQTEHAHLHFLHVVEPIPNYGYLNVEDIEAQCVSEAKDKLKALVDDYGLTDVSFVVICDAVKSAVLKYAQENKIDLIVIGSHSHRHRALAWFLGSSAMAVLHGAECDVLVISL